MNDWADAWNGHGECVTDAYNQAVIYHPETREVRGADFHPDRLPDDGAIIVLPHDGSLEWESSGWFYTADGEFVDEPPTPER